MARSTSTERLSNRLRMLTHNVDGPLFHIRLAVQVGFDDETMATLQAAHFLEHMVCKFTSKRYPDGHRNQASLASWGATYNASTSSVATDYFIDCPVSSATRILRLMRHMLTDFQLDHAAVSNEGHSVREELSSRWLNSVFYRGERDMRNWLFDAHIRAATAEDHVANVDRLVADPELLVSFHRRYYRPERMAIIIVGPLSQLTSPLRRFRRACASLPARLESASPQPLRFIGPTPTTRIFNVPKATSTKVILRWQLQTLHGNRAMSADCLICRHLLTGGLSARLMNTLRVVHGLVYSVHVSYALDPTMLDCRATR